MRPIDGGMPDSAIRAAAAGRADVMRREVESITEPMGAHQSADWLRQRVADLGAAPFVWPGCDDGQPPPAGALAPMFSRAQCPLWWRRQLRRAVVRARETDAMHAGEVCARRKQIYCTDDTVERRRERAAANADMLAAAEIENEAGQVITLADAAKASTANKTIRRGELMTRIRGCEEWGEGAGMVGVFTTNTAASRFHAQTMFGGANPKHRGDFGPVQPNTPRDAQLWLRATWARCRAALAREKVRWFGFRVAEPHHDGCPHWHMLLWVDPGQADRLQAIMRAAWLAENGDEPGAQEHRFKAKALSAGGAVAYITKYIAKNIDDAGSVGLEGHRDTDQNGQTDMLGTGKAQRVEAWAAAWGIRQFQALGQPPVTVWRELRRIGADRVKGAAGAILAAHAAVQKTTYRQACWRGYMAAQGGAMTGRGYGIRIVCSEDGATEGRYGDQVPARIVGVEHDSRPGEWVISDRKVWKPKGTWADPVGQRGPVPIPGLGVGLRAFDLPRSGVNNCTQARPATVLAGRLMPTGQPLRTWLQEIESPGGTRKHHMNRFQSFQSVKVNDEASTLHGSAGSVRSAETKADDGTPMVDVFFDELGDVMSVPVDSLQAL